MKTLTKPSLSLTRVLYTPVQGGLAVFVVLVAVAGGIAALRYAPTSSESATLPLVRRQLGDPRKIPMPPPPQSSIAATDDLGLNRPPLGEYYVGVYVDSIDPALLAQLKIPQGVVVRYIVPGSPAEDAGLQPNDVLLSAADSPLVQVCALGFAVNKAKDTEMPIELLREGAPMKVTLTPAKRPEKMWVPPEVETVELGGAPMPPAPGTGKWIYVAPNAKTQAADQASSSATTAPDSGQAEALQKMIEKLEQELTQAHEEVKALKAKLAEQKKDK